MKSGFNTDIASGGVVYHIQTEDKGLKTPLILSLVYEGGTILASKRSPYDDLVEAGTVETDLEKRLARQHKLICAAVRAGRINDLKRMSMKEAGESRDGLLAKKQEIVKKKAKQDEVSPAAEKIPDVRDAELPEPHTEVEEAVWEIPLIEDVEIVEQGFVDGNMIIEEEIILPPDAVKIVNEMERIDPWVTDELKVKVLGNEVFQSGEQKNINVLVCRGRKEVAIAGAGIMVKILGSDFRPQIFHALTDSNGIAVVSVSIPDFRSGRAAILVRAIVGNEEAEIRRAISQGNG